MMDVLVLPEDVTGHTGMNFAKHVDGRECFYHRRLDKYVTQDANKRWTLECTRIHT